MESERTCVVALGAFFSRVEEGEAGERERDERVGCFVAASQNCCGTRKVIAAADDCQWLDSNIIFLRHFVTHVAIKER